MLLRPITTRFFCFLLLIWLVAFFGVTDLGGLSLRGVIDRLRLREYVFDLYVLSALVLLIPLAARRWVKGALYVIIYTLFIVDTFCHVKFGTGISPTIVQLICETNPHEAHGFLAAYVNIEALLLPMWLVLTIIALHTLCATLWRHTGAFLPPPIASLRKRTIINVCVALVLITCGYKNVKNTAQFIQALNKYDTAKVEWNVGTGLIYSPVHGLIYSARVYSLIRQQVDILADGVGKVNAVVCGNGAPEIVWIIGESFNSRHAQFLGYSKPNTPRQQRLKAEGQLIVYPNVEAISNHTSDVFKNLFTVQTNTDTPWYRRPLLCEAFRKAGYQVTFISNQFAQNELTSSFLGDPRTSSAQFDLRNAKQHEFDEGLIDEYHNMSALLRGKRHLTIFHLIGMHFYYSDRCPASRRRWTAADYGTERDLNNKERQTLADYDNAVLYNDSVVAEIVKRFAGKDAVIIYHSDHGEELFPAGQNRHIVGRRPAADRHNKQYADEFRIPMWIYVTPLYAQRHHQQAAELKAAAGKPINTCDIPHILLRIAGIRIKP